PPADTGTQPRIGTSPNGETQILRDVGQRAEGSAPPAIRDLIPRCRVAIRRRIIEAADRGDARRPGDEVNACTDREPAPQSRGCSKAEIGDRAVASQLVADRLRYAAQHDRVLRQDAERAIEIRRESAAQRDALGDL